MLKARKLLIQNSVQYTDSAGLEVLSYTYRTHGIAGCIKIALWYDRPMERIGAFEYVCISMAAGGVDGVNPENPDTKTALEAGQRDGLMAAVNKMDEYGYKLLEGTSLVLNTSLGGASIAIFMYRER